LKALTLLKTVYNYLLHKRPSKNTNKLVLDWESAGRPVPPPHAIKQLIITQIRKESCYDLFIETGTYLGEMVAAQKKNFNQIYSIELSKELYLAAKNKFSSDRNVTIINGDSGDVLPELLRQVNKPAIFWLDGHYSAGITAKGNKDCPIFEELSAIFNSRPLKHILLIDDARLFTGENDYPKMNELLGFIKGHRPTVEPLIIDDIIHVCL
jgi:hypothetical protein